MLWPARDGQMLKRSMSPVRCSKLALLGALLAVLGCREPTDDDPGGMPPSSGTVAPLQAQTLNEGNLGLSCDEADIKAAASAWLEQMTLEQKVFEMHGLALMPANDLYRAGGDEALGIPSFEMVDGPRGVRAGNATAFPVGMARGATWDPELERRVGLAMGLETAAKGGNVLLAPTINLLRHPGWGRAQETYSEDPFHMGRMALGFIAGVQNHVLASAKHFAVNSIENTRFTMSANLDERTLREVYLPHFRVAVELAGVASVMSAYNRVNGTYCGEHEHLLRDILKGDWGFAGFVESDWVFGTRTTVPAALAGLDIEMPAGLYFGDPLIEAVNGGEVPESVIDEAVLRILERKLCFGLDDPATVDPAVVESEAHRALALEVAHKSIVLLDNHEGLLPLSEDIDTLAVVGALSTVANLGDLGSSSVTPSTSVTPLDGLEARLGSEHIVSIPSDTPSADELAALDEVDVAVIIVGLTHLDEGEYIPPGLGTEFGEGGDRLELGLPAVQVELIEAVASRVEQTVVVVEAGSAVLVRPWVESVSALLMAWYPGMEGGTALADIIMGEVGPSGRLPVSLPRDQSDLPPWDIESDEVSYEFLHGYRLLDADGREPEFAFGFGLGYSETELGRPSIDRETAAAGDTVTVSVDVYNHGERAMDEIVQIYASAPDSSVERAPKVLVGFSRVSLDPGEVKTVQIEIDVSASLSHWDLDADAWQLEPTSWTLLIGRSSRDLPLELSLQIQ